MPLNYNGNLIDNFTLTLKDGVIVDYSAEKGLETLKELFETDKGAKKLGEVALVPYDSLIHVDFMIGTSDLNIVWLNEDGTEVDIFIDGNFVI